MSDKKIFFAIDAAGFNDETAQKYGERIEELMDENGIVTKEAIVGDASNKESPLYDYFDWDDTKASHKWRLEQARHLVKSIKIETTQVSNEEDIKIVRAFTSINPNGKERKDKGYVSFDTVIKDEDKYDEFILQMYLTLMRNSNGKYKMYKELEPLMVAIDKILDDYKEILNPKAEKEIEYA